MIRCLPNTPLNCGFKNSHFATSQTLSRQCRTTSSSGIFTLHTSQSCKIHHPINTPWRILWCNGPPFEGKKPTLVRIFCLRPQTCTSGQLSTRKRWINIIYNPHARWVIWISVCILAFSSVKIKSWDPYLRPFCSQSKYHTIPSKPSCVFRSFCPFLSSLPQPRQGSRGLCSAICNRFVQWLANPRAHPSTTSPLRLV